MVALLDQAGIRRALILSAACTWGKASRTPVDDEYEHVRAENDWTAQYPTGYVPAESANPLKAYALEKKSPVAAGIPD